MSTVSVLPGGKALAAVKGAPETIKTMLSVIPEHYDDTYKWFTRKGSRVLALGMKEMEAISVDKVSMIIQYCPVCLVHFRYCRSTNS
jgi:manganese-transporting P-type ATPase